MIEQDPEGFPDFGGSLPHQVFLEMARKREPGDITMTRIAEEQGTASADQDVPGRGVQNPGVPGEVQSKRMQPLIAPLAPPFMSILTAAPSPGILKMLIC
jgi:hypothetical protein